jgi:hypothetical protein
MPNWCENKLDVSGNKIDIQKFKELTLVKLGESDDLNFTMEILRQTPTELLEQTSPNMWRGEEDDIEGKLEFEKKIEELKQKYGYTDWYNWRVDNWGTKWDVAETYILDDEDEFFSVQYNTAWAPNIEWVRYVAKQFPELTFTLSFTEPGMGYCGVYEVTDEDDDLCEGDLEWIDEDSGRLVEWSSDDDRWMYIDTKEIIDDEDFYPQEHNPFIN